MKLGRSYDENEARQENTPRPLALRLPTPINAIYAIVGDLTGTLGFYELPVLILYETERVAAASFSR
eukprot:scaffold143537_cov27-Attheya_sp.AAC.1